MRGGPFEITSADIERLDDGALRILLGWLLRAEAQQHAIPDRLLTLGGHPDAPDGGIDAMIAWSGNPDPWGWLPRRSIVFQSKACSMRPTAIQKELAPRSAPRDFFAELVTRDGAYILFCSERVTQLARDRRLAAMSDALAVLPGHDAIHLDFYDADRIASWANDHQSVRLRLLELIGRPRHGWQPFGAWSSPGMTPIDYLIDEAKRAVVDRQTTTALNAVSAVRARLSHPRGCVRLTGVSGVGKTRFAEALFDPSVGAEALPTNRAIYADAGHQRDMPIASIVEQIAYQSGSALIIVDNCHPDLHRQLSAIVQQSVGSTALLSIDFDVAEDEPNGTLNVRLLQNSDELIGRLVQSRFPERSMFERLRIAEFAAGNARAALAVAKPAGARETSQLNDQELIARLFQEGRRSSSVPIRACAEAAAFVGAFTLRPETGPSAELPVLAALAGMSDANFYRGVAELLDWGLMQRRGVQVALLPPAVALHLLRAGLNSYPVGTLGGIFEAAPERLRWSFASRLGDLKDEVRAKAVADYLLRPDGPFTALSASSHWMHWAFREFAAISPASALLHIERSFLQEGSAAFWSESEDLRESVLEALEDASGESATFDRAMDALLALSVGAPRDDGGDPDGPPKEPHTIFRQRFQPRYSGTSASADHRFGYLRRKLQEDDARYRDVVLSGLYSTLWLHDVEALPVKREENDSSDDEAGPATRSELAHWARTAFGIAANEANLDLHELAGWLAGDVRHLFQLGLGDVALSLWDELCPRSYWPRGWRSISEVLHFGKSLSSRDRTKLKTLERKLRPHDLDDLFDCFVLDGAHVYRPRPTADRRERRSDLIARAVGRAVGRAPGWNWRLVKRALHRAGNHGLDFGAGLATGDLQAVWAKLLRSFTATPYLQANIIEGFLNETHRRSPELFATFVTEAASEPHCGPHIASFLRQGELDRGLLRVLGTALRLPSERRFELDTCLTPEKTTNIPAADLVDFLRNLRTLPEWPNQNLVGALVDVVWSHLATPRQDNRPPDQAFVELGGEIIRDVDCYLWTAGGGPKQCIAEIIDCCLADGANDALVYELYRTVVATSRQLNFSFYDLAHICSAMVRAKPSTILDAMLADPPPFDNFAKAFFGADDIYGERPEFTACDPAIVEQWIAHDPKQRTLFLARHIPLRTHDHWPADKCVSAAAHHLLGIASNKAAVLDIFGQRFDARLDSNTLHPRLALRWFEQLDVGPSPAAQDCFVAITSRLADRIEKYVIAHPDPESRFE